MNRYAELIPCHMTYRSVSQLRLCLTLVNDKVLPHFQVFGTNGHMILIIPFVFIQGEILVDIFDIRKCLIGSVIALTPRVGIRRVALRIVDELITPYNVCLHLVVIRTAEIMIVIVGRVVHDTIEDSWRDLPLDRCQELLVGIEGTLFLIAQSVES